jgi:hypothetical protein
VVRIRLDGSLSILWILDIYDETGNIIFTLDDIDETFFDADTHDIIITQEMLDRQRVKLRAQEGNELAP